MSFGGSNSKNQSTSQSQNQSLSGSATAQTIDPTLEGLLTNNAARAQGIAGTPAQAYNGLLTAAPASQINDASAIAQGVGSYQPQTVQAGMLSNTNLSPYENPYQSDVINSTLAQAMRAKGITDTNDASAATAAGAFGGSRSAVLQNLDDNSWQQNLQQTLAGLNAGNFSQAQGAASQDIANKLTAATANQTAGLNAAGLQNSAAGLLGNLGEFNTSNTMQGLLNQYQEFLRQQNDPLVKQQLINQSLGLLPNPVLTNSNSFGASNGSSTGQSTGSGSSSNFNSGITMAL